MSNEQGIDETGLVQEKTVLEAFSDGSGVDAVINEIQHIVGHFNHDMKTAASRKRTASLSAKVSKVKTRVDGIGKELVSGWKTQAKVIDANRKRFREEMDSLRDTARQPLKEWEDEEERIKQEKEDKIEADKLSALIESDHEIAILLNEKRDDDIAAQIILEAEADMERKRVERESIERAAKDKAERELIEQSERVARDKLAAEAAVKQAAIDTANAEAATKQAVIDAENAKKQAVIDAEASAERARLVEVARQKKESDDEAAALAKREANNRHVGSIRKAAKEAVMAIGISESDAKSIVLAISKGKIPNVSISY